MATHTGIDSILSEFWRRAWEKITGKYKTKNISILSIKSATSGTLTIESKTVSVVYSS